MVILSLVIEIYIYEAYSLKDKRRIVKSILDRSRQKHHVSSAEVDENELWNKATLAFAHVSNNYTHSERVMQAILNDLDREHEFEVLNQQIEVY